MTLARPRRIKDRVSEQDRGELPLFAALMAARGLEVSDVALECGVSLDSANDWRRGLVYPTPRYAYEMSALFGKVDARRLYEAREAHKAALRRDRDEGRALRTAANVLDGRGLGELAARVRREAGEAGGIVGEKERAA